jgi:putative lipoic acid-binding regulatory protein
VAFDNHTLTALQSRLDESFKWPCLYVFKFIVGRERVEDVAALFPGVEIRTRDSRNGRYVGVTAEVTMESSSEVIRVYREAARIEGIIAL